MQCCEPHAQARPTCPRIERSSAHVIRALVPCVVLSACRPAVPTTAPASDDARATPIPVRVATFNASMFRDRPGALAEGLAAGDAQAHRVAEVIQRIAPDVILVAEFDEDPRALASFATDYLALAHGEAAALQLPYTWAPHCNTGVASGRDLDADGRSDGPGDAWGFGAFPGQYCFAILSRYPILGAQVRTFAELRWASMPGHAMPPGFWPEALASELRLSSKSHADVPIAVGDRVLHLLASHPTPPSFDGPEDRNGRRNADEIRLWADYIDGGHRADWIVDDAGGRGGLADGAAFVVLGDLNADPNDGDSRPGAIARLLDHPHIDARMVPTSVGAQAKAVADGGINREHRGDPAADTADFGDERPGNLRIDYVLPSRGLEVRAAAVFWPAPGDPHASLADVSDHHAVWIDLEL